jgi:manganese peroxidase
MRLQSDYAIARDPRTACLWQGMIGTAIFDKGSEPSDIHLIVDKQEKMMTEFKAAMAKMQVLGQPKEYLADCSEVSTRSSSRGETRD